MFAILLALFCFASFNTVASTGGIEKWKGLQNNATIRSYTLNLTSTYSALDGKYRTVFQVNGQNPGPLLIGDEGDWFNVTVVNNLEVPITIHYHGIKQKNTPWFDGVPGITQYPIMSGCSFNYFFQVTEQYGAAWYHAHYRGYSSDGIYGSIYIRPKKDRDRPYRLITNNTKDIKQLEALERDPTVLLVSDYYKVPMDDIMARMSVFGIDPVCVQSILINGKGRVFCHEKEEFESLFSRNGKIPTIDCMGCIRDPTNGFPGIDNQALEAPGYSRNCENTTSELFSVFTNNSSWQYMNVINAGGQFTKVFSIDDHEFYVTAVDGLFVHPRKMEQIIIPVGSKVTIVVPTVASRHKNTHLPFKMRFAATFFPQFIESYGLLYYGREEDHANHSIISSQHTIADNGRKLQTLHGSAVVANCSRSWPMNFSPLEPEFQLKHRGKADHTFQLYLNRTGVVDFSMFRNKATLPLHSEKSRPLLFDPSQAPSHVLLNNGIKRGDVVDIILNNFQQFSHPIHLHGHYFHLISHSETENFPYSSVEEAIAANYTELRLSDNTPLLDVTFVYPAGHAVIRFEADNPGIWMLHCHNMGHLLGGMGAILFEAIEEIPSIPANLLL